MININGEEWKVLLVAPSHPALRRSDGYSTLGCCDDILKIIFINDEIDESKIKKVLCHELAHAAMFSYNVDLSYKQEEIVANIIATYGQEIIETTNYIFLRLKEKRGA